MNKYKQILAISFATVAGGLVTVNAQPDIEKELSMMNSKGEFRKIYDDETLIFKGKQAKITKDKYVSFILNASHMSFVKKMQFLAGAYPYTAVVFDGKENDKNKICPLFKLAGKDYTIEQAKPGELVFEIKVPANNQKKKIDLVKKSGCIITDNPELSRIKWL